MMLNTTFNIISAISWQSVLSVEETGVPWENHRPVAIKGCIFESCAILSLQGVFMRVVLFYHYRIYLWELCYSIITGCICESCAILSLQGVFMRVMLFYHYRAYLWELCYSIITWFICESCAILSLHCLFVRVVLFYHYMFFF